METAGKNMKRKATVLTLSAMLFALCFSVEAQQTGPSDLAGLLMVAALSATVGLVLFLIWALNQPFAGLIRVEPVAFHQVWSIID